MTEINSCEFSGRDRPHHQRLLLMNRTIGPILDWSGDGLLECDDNITGSAIERCMEPQRAHTVCYETGTGSKFRGSPRRFRYLGRCRIHDHDPFREGSLRFMTKTVHESPLSSRLEPAASARLLHNSTTSVDSVGTKK